MFLFGFPAVCAAQSVRATAIVPSTNALYVSIAGGTVVQSSDSGRSWSLAGPGLPAQDVTVLLAVGFPTVLFAGTPSGVFRSRDQGMTWAPANSGLTDPNVSSLSGSVSSSLVIYAGTPSGVFRSVDGGEKWSLLGLTKVTSVASDPSSPDTVYAGTSDALYRSTNGGSSWVKTGLTVQTGNLNISAVTSIAIDPNRSSALLVTTFYAYAPLPRSLVYVYGVFRSDDQGTSFSPANPGGGAETPYVSKVLFDPDSRAFLVGVGVFVSGDRGATWTKALDYSGGLLAAGSASSSLVLAGGNEGFSGVLFSSSDHGTTWSKLPLPSCLGLRELLCLGEGGRFQVKLSAFLSGQELKGRSVPLTRDSGAFWLLTDNNIEVVVKVLDGRALNRHFWVFIGSLTDLSYTLSVNDTSTNSNRGYRQNAGEMRSVADTSAFIDLSFH